MHSLRTISKLNNVANHAEAKRILAEHQGQPDAQLAKQIAEYEAKRQAEAKTH